MRSAAVRPSRQSLRRRSPIARVALAGAVAAVSVAGCAGFTRVSDQPPPGFMLAGTWKLDPQLSTDSRAALQHILPKPRKRTSTSSEEDTDSITDSTGTGTDNGSGTGQGQGQGEGRRSRSNPFPNEDNPGYPVDISLQQSLLSGGDYLKIQQRPDEFVVWNGDTTRSYVPGEQSVVSVPSGVADQRSGWKGKAYWISIRPQVGPSVTEEFHLTDDGKHLIETIDVASDHRVRSLKVTRVYDHSQLPPVNVPEGD
ncbi:MAG: hypothetical protein WBE92_02335 [Steroidobacteraceae bacterium]